MFACLWVGMASAAAPLVLDRALEKDERDPPPEPDWSASTVETRAWWEGLRHRRDLQAMDAYLRWRLVGVGACAGERPVGASAVLTVNVDRDGRIGKLGATRDGDLELVRCARASWEGEVVPLLLHHALTVTYTLTVATDATPVAAAAPASPADTPADPDAFAPLADRVPGFAPLAWGQSSDGIEGLSAYDSTEGTTFYKRDTDEGGRLFGLPVGLATYGFESTGFYVAAFTFDGETTDWRLREALTAQYGEPRWDPKFACYYWRGNEVLLYARPVPNTHATVVTFMDIARARASHLADRLPGDREDPTATSTGHRLPRIYKDDPVPPLVNGP